jgi:deoxyribonuclease IV
VLHPGAYTEKDVDYGIARIAEGLNEVLKGTSETDVKIALETMAGKGTEIGRSFEELARIMEGVEDNSRLTVCLDTCHIHDAGYDIVNDLDGVLQEFDRIVGLDKLAVLHLNDSKNPRGAGKDRHAPVGAGWIGFEAMKRVVDHEALQHLPMVLETPWIGKDADKQRPMYEAEIALLRGDHEARFGGEFLEDVEKLGHFFQGQEVDRREFIVRTWETLKSDAKARKADPREPMDRLYDMVAEGKLFTNLTEEQVNHRLTAWMAGINAKAMA